MKRVVTVNAQHPTVGLTTLADAIAFYGLPDACYIFYHERNTLAVLPLERLVLKSFRRPSLLVGLMYRWLRPPKSRRSYTFALRLRRMGINTPEPAFAIETYRCSTALGSSYYACTYLEGWHQLRGIEGRDDFASIAKALAAFIYKIHSNGVWFKDMTPGNILFIEKDGGYDFALVDINRMEFDVYDSKTLFSNFHALLDTEDGTAAVAAEYWAISAKNGMTLDSDDFVGNVRLSYRAWRQRQERQRRFKNIFRKHKK